MFRVLLSFLLVWRGFSVESSQEKIGVVPAPLIVLKEARCGSTWLGDELSNTNHWCHFTSEVALKDILKAHKHEGKVAALRKGVEQALNCTKPSVIPYGAFTIHDSGSTVSALELLKECQDILELYPPPHVITLIRMNVIAAAVSNLKSKSLIRENGSHCAFHQSNCPEMIGVRFHVAVDALLKEARDRELENEMVIRLANELFRKRHSSFHMLTYEDLTISNGLAIPKSIREFFSLPSVPEQNTTNPHHSCLKDSVENFEEVYDYLRKNYMNYTAQFVKGCEGYDMLYSLN